MKEATSWVEFLNKCLALDPDWVKALVTFRPPCNDAILNHPSIQCLGPDEGGPAAGIVGLLNGHLGDGYGPIGIEFEGKSESGKLIGFHLALRPGETSSTLPGP